MNKNPIRDFFLKRRQSVLPWVTDWSSPQNHIRYEDDVRELDYWDWLWVHPSAYMLVMYSLNISTMLSFGFATWWVWRYSPLLSLFTFFFVVSGFFALIKNIRQRDLMKHTTFYDLFMRDGSSQGGIDGKNED